MGPPGRTLMVVGLVGALAFGLFWGYEAWTNDTFPSQQRPFGDYANVTSATFNGTEYEFTVTWKSGDYLPLYSQMTSATSDSANTPVCSIGVQSVQSGQAIFMPFAINGAESSLSNVVLSIAVRPVGGGSDFTIAYNVTSVNATPGDIYPSGYACQQPSAPM